MGKSNNIWIVSLKVIMMSFFATIVSFMLNCLIAVVAADNFFASDAVGTRIAMQAVGLFVEFIFKYGVIWECGHTDQSYVNLKQKNYSVYRGVLIGLIGAVPYYLMAIAMMLMSFDLITDITGLLRAFSSQFWGIYTFLLPVATTTNETSDPGIAQSIATPAQAIAAVFVPTIIPVISQIPYILGRKGISIGERLVFSYKKKK